MSVVFGLCNVPVVRLAPEVVAGRLGLRRDGIEIAHADAVDAASLRGAGAGRRAADIETQERRRHEIDDLPAIDVAGKAAGLDEGGRRRRVDDPAGDHHVVRRAIHLDLGVSTSAELPMVVSCTKARWVRSSRLSTMSCQFASTCRYCPFAPHAGSSSQWKSGIVGGSAQRRIAHPDPDPAIALDHRIDLHPGARGMVSCPGTRTQGRSRR